MSIFLDTGKVEDIKQFLSYGIIDGVTTNPSILVKEGINPGINNLKNKALEIAKLIDPLPLSIEVTSND